MRSPSEEAQAGLQDSGRETALRCTTLDEVIERVYGPGLSVAGRQRVFGGDINEAFLLRLTDGRSVFLKENKSSNASFFDAEEMGLRALEKTAAIGVPKVHAHGIYGDRAFLLMDSLISGPSVRDFWERFGHALADMHRAPTDSFVRDGRYGFGADNFIGAGPQKNDPRDSWIDFFRECRLLPQAERAKNVLSSKDMKHIEHLMKHLDRYLPEPDQPSLLHGDLWGGNFMVGPDGLAWLIDPAVYVGSAEADIAMTELFGGFSDGFYDAYRESGLLLPGYEERRDLYNLYHMLNHLNLFGGSYLYAVERIIEKY